MIAGTPLDLVADIGGTNARFALTDPAATVPALLHVQSLRNDDFASLEAAAAHYLAAAPALPRRAAIAVASPLRPGEAEGDGAGDQVELTNRAWSFGRRQLQQSLRLERLLLLNDFGAVAWALPALTAGDRVVLHGATDGPLRGPVSVLGPGTGLGVAQLVGSLGHGWQVVETEGGHVSFAPLCDEERQIARWLAQRFGRVSNERVLCGAGLSHIDAVLGGAAGMHAAGSPAAAAADIALRDPAQIVAAALGGNDPVARRALARFCAVLGSVAGDAALIHGARSVAIAGGMAPRFIDFLRGSAFRERFLAKGRFREHLSTVAIQLITHPNPGLLGAATALRAIANADA